MQIEGDPNKLDKVGDGVEIEGPGAASDVCVPNAVTEPNAAEALQIVGVKAAAQRMANLEASRGVLERFYKKKLTPEVAATAFEVALNGKHYNDELRNTLLKLMQRDVTEIANASLDPEWKWEAKLQARWVKELKDMGSGPGWNFDVSEVNQVLAEVYESAANNVDRMGYNNKSIKGSAKFIGEEVATEESEVTEAPENKEGENKFEVFKCEEMLVHTGGVPTNTAEKNTKYYHPTKFWVIIATDDPSQVEEIKTDTGGPHQKVFIGDSKSHAELNMSKGRSMGYWDARTNTASTRLWVKDIKGEMEKIRTDAAKGKYDL